MFNFPHRRLNPLSGEWVLVSPHRTMRPWMGQVEKRPLEDIPAYDPHCYLCPGNQRAGGVQNPQYTSTFVFTNDFAALLPEPHPSITTPHALLQAQGLQGTCRVICFSPQHNLTLPLMPVDAISHVIQVWIEQSQELGEQYRWVQVFENKGAIMGASNPHPHGQVWATSILPNEPNKEQLQQHAYFARYHRPLLLDYAELEIEIGDRLVIENSHWIALVPYWAIWPLETLLLPRRQVRRLPDLSTEEQDSLAQILKDLLIRYDNIFETSFPYSMGWHGAPFDHEEYPHWQLHAHFYPPLLRSATIKKFMVGYEMLGEAQRDITPEIAAQHLRELPTIHYTQAE